MYSEEKVDETQKLTKKMIKKIKSNSRKGTDILKSELEKNSSMLTNVNVQLDKDSKKNALLTEN